MPKDESQDYHYVVSAAIRHKTSRLIVCGVRHFDFLMHQTLEAIYGEDNYKGADFEQGFVTSKGEYLTREQAYELALSNKQYLRRLPKLKLYSEDLY
jgi:hypothetical protein